MMKYKDLLCVASVLAMSMTASAGVIYDSIPDPDPFSLPSIGYEATSTDELGDHIAFAPGTGRNLDTIRVGMVTWATYDSSALGADATGWDQALTFNIYGVDTSGSTPAVGSLLLSLTDTFHIPWAPAPTPERNPNRALAPVVFDFSSFGFVLPDEIIFGLAFNTQHYGATPTGASGPQNSLNFGLSTVAPSIGTNVESDALFWDTSYPGYNDSFVRDTGWAPYTTAIEISVVPIPAAAPLGLVGMGLVAFVRRRKNANA